MSMTKLPSYLWRGIYKLTLGKWKYKRGESYDAQRYWGDRFKKYGQSLRGPGHEGLSDAENLREYTEAGEVFTQFYQNNGVSFKNKRILEIGCGTGFYTELISTLGENIDFVGLDVTDVKFPELQAKFPYFKFIQADITHTISDMKPFDIVVMIDVIQHIVTDEGFRAAMYNIVKLLAQNGVFIVAPISSHRNKKSFYVRSWPLEVFQNTFSDYHFSKLQEFRGDFIGLISRRTMKRNYG